MFSSSAHRSILPGRYGRMLKDRPLVFRHLISVISVACALGLASLIPSRADPSHYTFFFVAVMLSAWYGGFVSGLVSTILSALSLDYFFIAPIQSVEMDWRALVRLGVFLSVASITSYLASARKRAEDALRAAHAELEDRVQQRTAELARINNALRAEIVERNKAEKELLRLQLEMGRVERFATLGKMAATIAHDLGTPLNSVLGYAQLLSQETLTERARRRLTTIENQINRMVEIIQRYLSHTRGELLRDRLNINDLVRDTLLLLQPAFQQHGIEVTANLADTLPALYGDGLSLQRALINLLDNAMDACSKNGAVRITTGESPADARRGPGVKLDIADNGAGIPVEILPKLFDFFVTTKPEGKGTGLGLVICQEIIKAHGGTINVTSEVGRGTTVGVFLPTEAPSEQGRVAEEKHERTYIDRG